MKARLACLLIAAFSFAGSAWAADERAPTPAPAKRAKPARVKQSPADAQYSAAMRAAADRYRNAKFACPRRTSAELSNCEYRAYNLYVHEQWEAKEAYKAATKK